ncbi:MAG TPA: DUF92 domain-containing protein [Candidatus Eisenbacteria bacterium]|nr:DUF92 domain-containing protein [Candidatus Eisenbacteria bacterium]
MITGATVVALALATAGAVVVRVMGQGTRAGAAAGLLVAFLCILGLGPGALLPLAVFVLGGGALTRFGRSTKEAAGAAEANQGRRGARHVAAKLSIPALLGIAGMLGQGGQPLSFAYAAALAGAFADTCATEIGPLGGGFAFALHDGRLRRVPHGTAGGVSVAGLIASAVAATAVAWASTLSGLIGWTSGPGMVAAAGFTASLLESIVGATALGGALGHYGRNLMVSAVASAIGYWAGASGWGKW